MLKKRMMDAELWTKCLLERRISIETKYFPSDLRAPLLGVADFEHVSLLSIQKMNLKNPMRSLFRMKRGRRVDWVWILSMEKEIVISTIRVVPGKNVQGERIFNFQRREGEVGATESRQGWCRIPKEEERTLVGYKGGVEYDCWMRRKESCRGCWISCKGWDLKKSYRSTTCTDLICCSLPKSTRWVEVVLNWLCEENWRMWLLGVMARCWARQHELSIG